MSVLGGVVSIKTITFLMFCLFAIAAVGYALGRITIKGVALGTAGVFIVALLFGCFFYTDVEAQTQGYTANALKIIENMGLVLFVTSVGFIAGPKFFGNFKRNFKSYVLLGLIIIVFGGVATVLCIYVGRAMGLCSGNNDELTAMMAGLLTGSGVGLLVMFRMNHDRRDSLLTLGLLYASGVILGLLAGQLPLGM